MEFKDQDVPGPKRNFVGYGRHQPKVVWPDHANVAVNLVVNYEEGSAYSKPAAGSTSRAGGSIITTSLSVK